MAQSGMTKARPRPLSPHLGIYRWGPHMMVSILNRMMGVGLATLGMALFTMGLMALALGPDAWAHFIGVMRAPVFLWLGRMLGMGLTFALFLHMLAGIRHFVMDIGAGFELKSNRTSAILTLLGAAALTLIVWAIILLGRR
ncbi:MAG: succinate dehydrogenase, cytochrome b556 subunit [Alphaproteobacteria bacterium]|nr:succinate dehydrogenase, cytochrome b556 subunit [Alphaproteobacteria bacterium]MDE2340888.1 succinate dehydrogenase, cytochrome b556 subunit [Alphaproteobacteria bacterium]